MKLDSAVFITVSILLGLGVVIVYSASSFKAQELVGDSHFFLKNHLYKVVAGIILMLVLARVNYRVWLNISPVLLAGCFLILLYLLFSPTVTQIRGSRRWVSLAGFAVQPSDFARLALILFLSLSLGATNFVREKSMKSFGFHLGAITLIALPILLQPDAGSALLITMIALTILFVAGEKLRYLFLLVLAGVPTLYFMLLTENYQKDRIEHFLASIMGGEIAWQAKQALIALGNGHITGLGLGGSLQKLHFLPDPFTDFIFAIVGEELGLVGTATILLLFSILISRGFQIANQAPDFQGKILATAITISIAAYATTNIGVVLNLLPTTGIPLPFVSYGGSALIVNLMMVGILLNIASQGHFSRGQLTAKSTGSRAKRR